MAELEPEPCPVLDEQRVIMADIALGEQDVVQAVHVVETARGLQFRVPHDQGSAGAQAVGATQGGPIVHVQLEPEPEVEECTDTDSESDSDPGISADVRRLVNEGAVTPTQALELSLDERRVARSAVRAQQATEAYGTLNQSWRLVVDAGECTAEQAAAALGEHDDTFRMARERFPMESAEQRQVRDARQGVLMQPDVEEGEEGTGAGDIDPRIAWWSRRARGAHTLRPLAYRRRCGWCRSSGGATA